MENDNRYTFARNLQNLMDSSGRSRRDISEALGISYFTVSDWVNGKKYPRMDKVELLANYFGVLKSDLIEEKGNSKTLPSKKEEISEGERALLDLFRRVPEDKQEVVLEMIRLALKTQQ